MQRFNDVVNQADTGQKAPTRAMQAWQYLIAKAHNRQIARYGELREIMGYPDDRPLRPILACIMWWCEQNGIPPLTIIVVNQSGVPGKGFLTAQSDDYHQQRENVFNYPWWEVVPPTASQYREAHTRGYASAPTPPQGEAIV